MPEPTSRELYDIINAMRVEIAVMSTKMDSVMESKKTAEDAKVTANQALLLAQDNSVKIDGIKKTAMWAIGLMVPAIIAIGIAAF